jgi:hypothetical protein
VKWRGLIREDLHVARLGSNFRDGAPGIHAHQVELHDWTGWLDQGLNASPLTSMTVGSGRAQFQ